MPDELTRTFETLVTDPLPENGREAAVTSDQQPDVRPCAAQKPDSVDEKVEPLLRLEPA